MQAFEGIDLVQLVTVTGGESGTASTVKGNLEGQTAFGGIKASGSGEVSSSTSNDVALFDRTTSCVKELKDPNLCLNILKTVKGQPTGQ